MNEKLLETMKQMNMTEEQIRLLEIKMITLADQVEEELQSESDHEEISLNELIQEENQNNY